MLTECIYPDYLSVVILSYCADGRLLYVGVLTVTVGFYYTFIVRTIIRQVQ